MKRRKFLITIAIAMGATALGGYFWTKRWKYIVIHHSAGNYGNIGFLQKVHRERQANDPVDAIPYHYIIGNGNGLQIGEVVKGWRQKYDVWGAHVSGNNMDHNLRGIGICLIGNFEEGMILPGQYDSLVELTKHLLKTYNISSANVKGHGKISGESTKCPGKNFPMGQFILDIS